MLGTLLAAVETGDVFSVFIDEVRFENGRDTMVVWYDYFALIDHLLEEEEQHALADGSGPGYFGTVGLTGEEFVEVVRECVFGNPADLDEFLAKHVNMADGDTTHGEGNIGSVLLGRLFGSAFGFISSYILQMFVDQWETMEIGKELMETWDGEIVALFK